MKSQRKSSKRLFIGSLPYRYTEGQLLSLFVEEGKIIAVRIIHNKWGRSRGMAYVEFENEKDAVRAKEKFHNYRVGDRTIIVDFAEPDPLSTPEGQARQKRLSKNSNFNKEAFLPHPDSDSQDYKRSKKQNFKKNKNDDQEEKPKLKYRPKKKVRQSVFDSRNFGSRVGAKFAKRTKRRKTKK